MPRQHCAEALPLLLLLLHAASASSVLAEGGPPRKIGAVMQRADFRSLHRRPPLFSLRLSGTTSPCPLPAVVVVCPHCHDRPPTRPRVIPRPIFFLSYFFLFLIPSPRRRSNVVQANLFASPMVILPLYPHSLFNVAIFSISFSHLCACRRVPLGFPGAAAAVCSPGWSRVVCPDSPFSDAERLAAASLLNLLRRVLPCPFFTYRQGTKTEYLEFGGLRETGKMNVASLST